MFSLFLVILGAVSIHGQSELPDACEPAKAAKNFNWDKFSSITWYQSHTTDKSYPSECITFKSVKDGETLKIHVMGYKENKEQMKDLKVTNSGTADFELNGDKKYTFIMYEEGKYAVVHECSDPEVPKVAGVIKPIANEKSISNTWILSSRPVLDFGDFMKIAEGLNGLAIAENIVYKDFKTTIQMGKTCSGGAVTQALAALMVACAALTRLI
ncbi:uncharacterized protein LOC143921082 [Arctopsyche grandis]|uniref:uncharacterized protein LOC143921082 n=1 Tax=Arctopsyche grandis TaxID=121162 RepID=UPI00406D9CE0